MDYTTFFSVHTNVRAYIERSPDFTMIRAVFDWKSLYDTILLSFQGVSQARLFKFKKNQEGTVILKYKTNPMEKYWKGIPNEYGSKDDGIVLVEKYLSIAPELLLPQQLNAEVINDVAMKNSYLRCYSESDREFFQSLQQDSRSYIRNVNFPSEGISLILC